MSIEIKDKLAKGRLKAWIREERGSYDDLVAIAAQYVRDLEHEEITGSNEFETLRALHIRQGKVDILMNFLSDIEKAIQ